MAKAINSFIDSQENQQEARETLVLKYLDFIHPQGERTKVIVRKKKKNPQTRLVTKVREVEYVYLSNNPDKKSKTTKGWEIVEEILVDRDTEGLATFEPKVVGKITKVIKPKNYNEQATTTN
jgi:hypothetical protein